MSNHALRVSDPRRDRYRDTFVAAREMRRRTGAIPESYEDALRWASRHPEAALLLRRRY